MDKFSPSVRVAAWFGLPLSGVAALFSVAAMLTASGQEDTSTIAAILLLLSLFSLCLIGAGALHHRLVTRAHSAGHLPVWAHFTLGVALAATLGALLPLIVQLIFQTLCGFVQFDLCAIPVSLTDVYSGLPLIVWLTLFLIAYAAVAGLAMSAVSASRLGVLVEAQDRKEDWPEHLFRGRARTREQWLEVLREREAAPEPQPKTTV
jgi:hypothetical protein